MEQNNYSVNQECNDHQKIIEFLEVDEKQLTLSPKCSKCVITEKSENSILEIKQILSCKDDELILNWPPIDNKCQHNQLDKIVQENNQRKLRQHVLKSLNDIKEYFNNELNKLEKEIFSQLDSFDEDKFFDCYNKESLKSEFISQIRENIKDINNIQSSNKIKEIIAKLVVKKSTVSQKFNDFIKNSFDCEQLKQKVNLTCKIIKNTFSKDNILYFEDEVNQIKIKYQNEINILKQENEKKINDLKEYQNIKQEHQKKIINLQERIEMYIKTIEQQNQRITSLCQSPKYKKTYRYRKVFD